MLCSVVPADPLAVFRVQIQNLVQVEGLGKLQSQLPAYLDAGGRESEPFLIFVLQRCRDRH